MACRRYGICWEYADDKSIRARAKVKSKKWVYYYHGDTEEAQRERRNFEVDSCMIFASVLIGISQPCLRQGLSTQNIRARRFSQVHEGVSRQETRAKAKVKSKKWV